MYEFFQAQPKDILIALCRKRQITYQHFPRELFVGWEYAVLII